MTPNERLYEEAFALLKRARVLLEGMHSKYEYEKAGVHGRLKDLAAAGNDCKPEWPK